MGAEISAAVKHWPCDICGTDDPRPIEAARPYIGGREPPAVCGNCGFVYVPDRRSSADIAKAWDDVWGEGYTSAWPAVQARLTYVAEWINDRFRPAGKSLIDVGAGEGHFLRIVRRYVMGGVGIEPDARNVSLVRSLGFACYHGTVEDQANTLGGNFDIATVLWTLENCGDCIGFLRHVRKLLKPNGMIVVATGSRILVPFKKPLGDYFANADQDLHCFHFSASALRGALIEAGFEPIAQNRWRDTDCMVMAGRVTDDDSPVIAEGDPPGDVMRFFDDWARMFP